ncbi:MAG TPA: hypothetical protein VHM31_00180 [Polyangia bacterium]|nr:hypothetical protein [Polyangia bacterium]
MKRRSLFGSLVLGLGFAWMAAGCGSVSTVGGTGGTPGQGTGGQAGGAAGTTGTGGGAGGRATGGAGGVPGTGGRGGATGAGGKGGKGGRGGEGGVAGAGEAGRGGGTAGSSGAGGRAGAGGAAGGGAGGHGGQSCDEIAAAFQAALPIAQSCSPGVEHQCEDTALVGPLTGCPGCAQYVNDNTKLNALRTQYTDAGCPHSGVCPAILCVQPQKAGCMVSDASAGGTCKPVLLTGAD